MTQLLFNERKGGGEERERQHLSGKDSFDVIRKYNVVIC